MQAVQHQQPASPRLCFSSKGITRSATTFSPGQQGKTQPYFQDPLLPASPQFCPSSVSEVKKATWWNRHGSFCQNNGPGQVKGVSISFRPSLPCTVKHCPSHDCSAASTLLLQTVTFFQVFKMLQFSLISSGNSPSLLA